MKPMEHNEPVLIATPISFGSDGLSERLERGLKSLKSVFRPSFNSGQMNARLIRDAGLDDLDRELTSHLKAPLIR
jgi:hypothetical protein